MKTLTTEIERYKALGIPTHKAKMFYYIDYYKLERSYHNFLIIFEYDYRVRALTSKYKSGQIGKKSYIKNVRKHLTTFYGLVLGSSLKTYIRRALRGR